MASLRQLVAQHHTLLLLDAGSTSIQVGLLRSTGSILDARWAVSDEEAGIGLFRGVQSLGVDIATVGAFAFADSPGSILGIRTAAMALRTWCALAPRPVYAYHALAILAHALQRREVTFIADARRDSWHTYRLGQSAQRIPTSALPSPLATPETFRHWSALPPSVERVPYVLADLLPAAAEADLFRVTTAPDAFLYQEPNYATWDPQIHRKP